MEDLDLLKKHWQKNNDFEQVDQTAIRNMLHKSSSSIVKKIFIISVIELCIGLLLNLIPTASDHKHLFFEYFEIVFSVVFYSFILYFIYQFYKNYSSIRNTDSTKVLLNKILKTRKNVGNYIQFNIWCFIFLFMIYIVDAVWYDMNLSDFSSELILFEAAKIALSGAIAALFIFGVRKIYKTLYIRLLNKLNSNYEELKNLSED